MHERSTFPIVSEFETQEQADAYECWFHAKIEASLTSPGRGVPHNEVMARMDALIDAAEARKRAAK
ncbi:stability determinant [Pseudomonas sp. KFB-139]|uniref:Stability determinant n=1 Tax=Pseudomonas serbiensis TaxID=3064350 RepID=A0ABT9CMU3_9PSED|nr:stability determinant [Pseudomonas sp. KFB-138]MDO7926148.1 stability determinant [Pseudomonas sp. KFB-138]